MMPTRKFPQLAAAFAIALLGGGLPAQSTSPCAGDAGCMSVTSFVAKIADFRNSTSGRMRIVTITTRFQNRTKQPLTLGYVQNSGIVTDDQGNRYVVYGENGVRGIGVITSGSFDPKFTLQPGESSDARFEFVWSPSRNEIFGTKYEVELAVREIDPLVGNQFRLGKEHALHFSGFSDQSIAEAQSPIANPDAPATGAVASPAPTPTPSAAAAAIDACGTLPNCYSAGPFTAQVARVTGSRLGNNTGDHMLQIVVRVRNVTTRPLVLGYKASTSLAIDNYGNRYYWGRAGTHDVSASGIGTVARNSADPQFTLAPGESRDATFALRRFGTGRNAIGSSFNYSLALEQLEILPGNQLRSVREFSLNFDDISAAAPAAASQQVNDEVGKLGQKLFDKLRGKPGKPR